MQVQTSGVYIITLSSEICDTDGWSIDQDYDGVRNEGTDRFTLSLELAKIDLEITSVEIPQTAIAGKSLTVSWTVKNVGTDTPKSGWNDSVYLSSDEFYDLNDIYLGTFYFNAANFTLNENESYTGTLTTFFPGILPGNYHVLVRTDINDALREMDEANNTAVSSPITVTIPLLENDVTITGFVTGREVLYYRLIVPETTDSAAVDIRFSTQNMAVVHEIYFAYDAIPTQSAYLVRSLASAGSAPRIAVDKLLPGTYYLMIRAGIGSVPLSDLGAFTLLAEIQNQNAFTILNDHFGRGGIGGNRTIEINGAGFDQTTHAALIDESGTMIAEPVVYRQIGSEKIFATFDLADSNISKGVYGVRLQNASGYTVTVDQAFEVTDSAASKSLDTGFISKTSYTSGTEILQFSFIWSNNTFNDIYSPQMTIYCSEPFAQNPTDALLGRVKGSFVFYPVNGKTGDLLMPGDTGTETFYALLSTDAHQVWYRTEVIDNTWYEWEQTLGDANEAFNWHAVKETLNRGRLTDEQFDTYFVRFTESVGPTNGDYLRMQKQMRMLFDALPNDGDLARQMLVQETFDRFVAANTAGISGKLINTECGLPLDSLVVTAQTKTENAVFTFTANVRIDGSFVFAALTEGTYTLTVTGSRVLPKPAVVTLIGETPLNFTQNVIPEAVLTGTVRDESGGVLAGARIRIEQAETGLVWQAAAGADGRFEIHDLMPGDYRVTVRCDGYIRQEASITFESGKTVTRNFSLESSGIIKGTVTNENGEGVADATVRAVCGDTVLYAVTDDFGDYRLSGMAFGDWLISVEKNGFLTTAEQIQSLDSTEPVTLDWQLSTESVLTGTVIDSAGNPVVGVSVTAVCGTVSRTAVSDTGGRWKIDALGAGDYTLSFFAAGYAPVKTTVSGLLTGETRALAPVAFADGYEFSGTVSDENGLPILGAAVTMESRGGEFAATVLTGSNGRFAFSQLPAGRYAFRIKADGFTTVTRTMVLNGDMTESFTMTREYALEGALKDVSGKPLAGEALVSLYRNSDGAFLNRVKATNGIYRFTGLAAGDYFVLPTSASCLFDAEMVTLSGDENTVALDFIACAGEITGTIRDDGGNPIAGAVVSLAVRDPLCGVWKSLETETDRFGRYTLAATPGGTILLTAEKNGFASQTLSIETVPGQSHSLDWRLSTSQSVQGTVYDDSGAPVANATVALIPNDSSKTMLSTKTDANGHYCFERAPVGGAMLEVYVWGYYIGRQQVALADATELFNIELARGEASLVGIRLDPETRIPADSGLVYLLNEDGKVVQLTNIGADGSFAFAGIDDGEYTLVFIGEAAGVAEVTVDGATVWNDSVAQTEFATSIFDETPLDETVSSAKGELLSSLREESHESNADELGVILARHNAQLDKVLLEKSWIAELTKRRDAAYDEWLSAMRLFKTGARTDFTEPESPEFYSLLEEGAFLRTEYDALCSQQSVLELMQTRLLASKSDFLSPANTTTYYLASSNSTISRIMGLSDEIQDFLTERKIADVTVIASLDAVEEMIAKLNDSAQMAEKDIRRMTETAKLLTEKSMDWSDTLADFNASVSDYLRQKNDYDTKQKELSIGEAITRVSLNGDTVTVALDVGGADFRALMTRVLIGDATITFDAVGQPSLSPSDTVVSAVLGENGTLIVTIDPPDTLCVQNDVKYSIRCQANTADEREIFYALGTVQIVVIDSDVDLSDLTNDPEKTGKELISRCEQITVPPSLLNDNRTNMSVSTNSGYGVENWVGVSAPLEYLVHFESEGAALTVPIQSLSIEQTLDSNFDFSTFCFGWLQFGSISLQSPQSAYLWQERLDLRNRYGIYVDLDASFDLLTGVLTCSLTSIDPVTGLLPKDFRVGFMLPSDSAADRSGFLSYTIRLKETTATGTQIRPTVFVGLNNFDKVKVSGNSITVDSTPAVSEIAPLKALSPCDFTVAWTVSDVGSGSAFCDVYYSVGGGAWKLWLQNTQESQHVFHAESGKTYYFYALATDSVGNRQTTPAAYISTTVQAELLVVSASDSIATWTDGRLTNFSVKLAVEPTANVVVHLESTDSEAGKTTVSELVFTPQNWNIAQSVFVRGGQASGMAGALEYGICLRCNSDDERFNGLPQRTVSLNNRNAVLYAPRLTGIEFIDSGGGYADSLVITFSRPILVQPMIEDGTICNAVTIESYLSGEHPICCREQFAWNPYTNQLTIAFDSPLDAGSYSVWLDCQYFKDAQGNSLAGGTGSNRILTTSKYASTMILAADHEILKTDGYSVPTLFDFDGDGLDDLFVGEKTQEGTGKIRYYHNEGTASEPVYVSAGFLSAAGKVIEIDSDGCLGAYPRFADLDGDGRTDLLVGCSDGRVLYYRNVSQNDVALFAQGEYLLAGASPLCAGERAAFDGIDWNNDGRLDLVVGTLDGSIYLYLNRAESNTPVFDDPQMLVFGTENRFATSGRASVSVVDFDQDGRKDILCGSTDGEIRFFKNIGTDNAPAFIDGETLTLAENPIYPDAAGRTRPFVADYNSDGVLDILVGDASGLVRLYLGNTNDSPTQLHYDLTAKEFEFELCAATPTLSVTAQIGCSFYLDASSLFDETAGGVFEWDLNGDGLFGNATGLKFWFPPNFYSNTGTNIVMLSVRKISEANVVGRPQTVLLKLIEESPTVSVKTASFQDGQILKLALNVDRAIARWRINWGDAVQEFDSTAAVLNAAHYYTPQYAEKGYTVTLELIDTDGKGAGVVYTLTQHGVSTQTPPNFEFAENSAKAPPVLSVTEAITPIPQTILTVPAKNSVRPLFDFARVNAPISSEPIPTAASPLETPTPPTAGAESLDAQPFDAGFSDLALDFVNAETLRRYTSKRRAEALETELEPVLGE